jgi:hypothetical protein
VPLQPECQCLVSRRLSPTMTPSGRHESMLLSRRVYAISSVPTPNNRIDADGTFHTLWSGDRTEIKVD